MSTYNKKLPTVSEIRWMKKDRTSRVETITMPFKGVIPDNNAYVGWRQSSYAYSYQIQYKVKARLVPSKQLATGSQYSETGWKYMNTAWSGDVNKLDKCVAMDKSHRYYRYFRFAGKSLMTKGSYDKLGITVRVRSYNKTKKQHGPWVAKQIYVKCKPDVKVYKIVALADGGVQIYFNTNGWKRGDSKVILNTVQNASGKKANKRKLTEEVGAIGGEEASGYPYAQFDGKNFNYEFEQNQKITLKNCVFRTCDGVDVSLDGTYTIAKIDADISEPALTINRYDGKGRLEVKVGKSDQSDDWDKVQAWLNCTIDDETVRINPSMSEAAGNEGKWFYFYPPLDCEIKLRVGITNNLGGKFWKTYTKTGQPKLKPFDSNGRIMINYTDGTDTQPDNGMFYGTELAVMNYETEYSIDAARPFEKELPFGREKPIAFLGEGIEKIIHIKGNIDSTPDGEFRTADWSGYPAWLKFQEHQGIVLARLPNSHYYTALCTQVNIEQADEFDDSRNVSLTLEEVSI